jgi:hypothetical protein
MTRAILEEGDDRMSIQLAPEIEAELRAEAEARGVSMATLIIEAVAAYFRKTNPSLVPQVSTRVQFRDRRAEMAWAAKPNPDYFGKWVVLEGNEVIAAGSEPKTIYDQVRARGIFSPFLIYVSPQEQEPFAGGWLD